MWVSIFMIVNDHLWILHKTKWRINWIDFTHLKFLHTTALDTRYARYQTSKQFFPLFPVLEFLADCPMDRIALIRMLRWQQVGAGEPAA